MRYIQHVMVHILSDDKSMHIYCCCYIVVLLLLDSFQSRGYKEFSISVLRKAFQSVVPDVMIPRPHQQQYEAGPSHRNNVQDTQHSAYTSQAAMAGSAMRAALGNPYAQYNMSPHYYQAYTQVMQPATNAEGYTLSSTYSPRQSTGGTTLRSDLRNASSNTHAHARTNDNKADCTGGKTHGSWYQPGNCRCTRQGCAFTGSNKSVEIHMMDRHFIFPPGWQKKDEWDTDPSLKG